MKTEMVAQLPAVAPAVWQPAQAHHLEVAGVVHVVDHRQAKRRKGALRRAAKTGRKGREESFIDAERRLPARDGLWFGGARRGRSCT